MLTTSYSILAVEAVMILPALLFGISHILHPQAWRSFFARLEQQGTSGVISRTLLFEFWPASLIVAFHQDWGTAGVFITIIGHILMVKVAISLLFPYFGLPSLKQANNMGGKGFIFAGILLVCLGSLAGWRVLAIT